MSYSALQLAHLSGASLRPENVEIVGPVKTNLENLAGNIAKVMTAQTPTDALMVVNNDLVASQGDMGEGLKFLRSQDISLLRTMNSTNGETDFIRTKDMGVTTTISSTNGATDYLRTRDEVLRDTVSSTADATAYVRTRHEVLEGPVATMYSSNDAVRTITHDKQCATLWGGIGSTSASEITTPSATAQPLIHGRYCTLFGKFVEWGNNTSLTLQIWFSPDGVFWVRSSLGDITIRQSEGNDFSIDFECSVPFLQVRVDVNTLAETGNNPTAHLFCGMRG